MKKFRAITAALVITLVLGVAGSVFLGHLLYDSKQENTLLADKMNVQTASMQAEIDDLTGELSALEASGSDKDSRIEDLEAQVETLEAQVADLEAQLVAKSTSGGSGSSASQGNASGSSASSSSSDTQSATVYITRTGEQYHRNSCQYLRESKIPIELSTAKARGYTACSVCY